MSVFCEKCGKKLEDGFAFCDKCGAKVEPKNKEEKHHEEKHHEEKIKEEKVENKPSKPIPPVPPKSGKGKIIFLTIMDILLLAATITFLILWLNKPTDSNSNSSYNSNNSNNNNTVEPKPTDVDDKFVGKWEQNVEYKKGNKVTKRTYGLLDLKKNGEFRSLFYDKDDISGTKEEIEGTYEIKNKKTIILEYKSGGVKEKQELAIKSGKICLDDDCESYLVKDGKDNKIVIYEEEDDEIETITYTQYEKLQKDYKDAIVVVINPGCSWCEKYESVVEEIREEYSTPVYYYKSDGKISISGTPTTIIIKNGYIVDTIEGYKGYSVVADILDDLGIK